MVESIIAPADLNVNSLRVLRTFTRKGEWCIEAVFEGGITTTGTATADEINTLESNLSDLGWRVSPSLFSAGFNAKPPVVEIEEDEWVMPFASGPGQWVDDYAILEPTL